MTAAACLNMMATGKALGASRLTSCAAFPGPPAHHPRRPPAPRAGRPPQPTPAPYLERQRAEPAERGLVGSHGLQVPKVPLQAVQAGRHQGPRLRAGELRGRQAQDL
jgi:hypothetical protein